jgi:PKD repeat protein
MSFPRRWKGSLWLLVGIAAVVAALTESAPVAHRGIGVASAQFTPVQVTAGGPYSGVVGKAITFSAQAFFGGVPTAGVTYQWNFGDGTTGFNQTTSHAYATAGTFSVTVQALTATGLSGVGSTVAQIGGGTQGGILQVSAGGPYSGVVGQAITFTAQVNQAFFQFGVQSIQYRWTFGDGTTGIGQTTSHAYASPGTFSVTVQVVSTFTGQSGTASTVAQIGGSGTQTGFLQVSAGGPYSGSVGQLIPFNAQAYTGGVAAIGATYQWNFGDGTTGFNQSTSHSYNAAGTYTVTVTVTTATGLSGSATTTVTVGGGVTPAPTPTPTPALGNESVNLFPGCTNVSVTWATGTATATVAAAIAPSGALTSIWSFINEQQRFVGYSPLAGAPNDLLTVNRAAPVFICVTSAATLTRPRI